MSREIAISALPPKTTSPVDADILVIVSSGTTYRIAWSDFMSSVIDALSTIDSAGNPFNPDSGSTAFTYTATGPTGSDVATITNVQDGVTRVQTFTYASNLLSAISKWVPQ